MKRLYLLGTITLCYFWATASLANPSMTPEIKAAVFFAPGSFAEAYFASSFFVPLSAAVLSILFGSMVNKITKKEFWSLLASLAVNALVQIGITGAYMNKTAEYTADGPN